MTNAIYDQEYVPKPGDTFDAYDRTSGRRNSFGPFVCTFAGKRTGKRCVESTDCRLWLGVWRFKRATTMRETNERCDNCYFWRKEPSGARRGTCHLLPQTVRKDATDFCGGYRPKGEPAPEGQCQLLEQQERKGRT